MTNLSHDHTPDDMQEARNDGPTARYGPKSITVRFPADLWRQLVAAFADTPDLATELTRLRAQVADARLGRANLAAAALATIAAHSDGEPDPLSYLRDELDAQGFDTNRGGR
jgi:hypothetical protein